jgi:syntaxin 18
MDLTFIYREIVRSKIESIKPLDGVGDVLNPIVAQPDRLTQECLTIYKRLNELKQYLIRIRPSYLSSSKPSAYNEALSDKQRDEIDYEARMILQQQLNQIRALEDLEKERVNKHKGRSGLAKFLADPKIEGTDKTVELHRAGVFWFLNDRLKSVSQMHAQQQELRLRRQVDKSKAVYGLQHAVHSNGHNVKPIVLAEYEQNRLAAQLPQDQLLELESENNALLNELEQSLKQAQTAEKALYEISQLQTNLATHLASQNDRIQTLLEDAFQTSIDVSAANRQLESARTRNRRASKMIVYSSLIISIILLFYDWIL